MKSETCARYWPEYRIVCPKFNQCPENCKDYIEKQVAKWVK